MKFRRGFLTIFAIFAIFEGLNCIEVRSISTSDSLEDFGGPNYKEQYGEVDRVPSWANPEPEPEAVDQDDGAGNIDDDDYIVDFPKALTLKGNGQKNEKVVHDQGDHDQVVDQVYQDDDSLVDLIDKISRNNNHFDEYEKEGDFQIVDGQIKEKSGVIEVENGGGFFIWRQIQTIINFQPETKDKDQQDQGQGQWTIIGEINSDSDTEEKVEDEDLLNFINYIELRSERMQSVFGLLLIVLSMIGICSIFMVVFRLCDVLFSAPPTSRNSQEENPPPEYELVISEDQYLKNFQQFDNDEEKEYSTIILA